MHEDTSNIVVMLQQQQGLLLTILTKQNKMEEKHSQFEAKLLELLRKAWEFSERR